jgi:D-aminopeptidase
VLAEKFKKTARRMNSYGSIIAVVATDAPLLPHQCTRLAQRAGLGVARVGGVGEHTSGDLFLCFATGNRGMTPGEIDEKAPHTFPLAMLADAHITGLFEAVVEATEEAIVNAVLGATTTEGRDGVVAHALTGKRLVRALGPGARRAASSSAGGGRRYTSVHS